MTPRPRGAVLFDLLTALIDSWSVWDAAAGSRDAGRTWRARYLVLTYGCGAYRPYETLVRDAARDTGLAPAVADRLEALWPTLPAWPEAERVLARLQGHYRLGVVTNCSRRLGAVAAARLPVRWDVVMTAEEAGWYKPDPRPYRAALDALAMPASAAVFVCGSGYDLFGTAACGLPAYWHNRAGLPRPAGAPAPQIESRTLADAPAWVAGLLPGRDPG